MIIIGFRTNSYAKCWEIKPVSDKHTKIRLSISKKNKDTGEYEQEFGGYVSFVGTACASKAAKLHAGDRIKLGDVDLKNKYDKENGVERWYPTVFSFELEGDTSAPTRSVDSGEPAEDDYPF